MRVPVKTLLAAALLLPSCLWAAIGYSRYAPKGAGFSFEYPADWKRQPGLQTVLLKPAGKEGASARVTIERRPLTKGEGMTAKDYVASLEKLEGVKAIQDRKPVEVAGRQAERLALAETADLKDRYGQKLPGPQKEVHVVVPLKRGYLVVKVEGVEPAFSRVLPEFDRIVSKLALEK